MLSWRRPDGAEASRPPVPLSTEAGAQVRRIKDELKELRQALTVERGRIEDLLVEERTWDLETWRSRYLKHPLSGVFGRRLIWRFETDGVVRSGMAEGSIAGSVVVDPSGQALELASGTRVGMWHPAPVDVDEIDRWRRFVLERRVHQPFKHAYREVYVVTAYEEGVASSSRRFAGHILAYPRARALMSARRWGSNFLGPFDGGDSAIARREFPSAAIRAEFYHDALHPDHTSPVLYCTTDEIRFMPIGPGPQRPLALSDVPPLVFSEAMRDVDLFVTVASVAVAGNQPVAMAARESIPWPDHASPWAEYWHRMTFGELSPTALMRRTAIEQTLSELAIADRCELLDRWLRVRGDARIYRIHLGSGNVVMEPDDRYLAFDPPRNPTSGVFLPFDDDSMLALILSKALMLANDRAIRDREIIRQIEAR
jgi:uncharacterized protein DUF4132